MERIGVCNLYSYRWIGIANRGWINALVGGKVV